MKTTMCRYNRKSCGEFCDRDKFKTKEQNHMCAAIVNFYTTYTLEEMQESWTRRSLWEKEPEIQ